MHNRHHSQTLRVGVSLTVAILCSRNIRFHAGKSVSIEWQILNVRRRPVIVENFVGIVDFNDKSTWRRIQ